MNPIYAQIPADILRTKSLFRLSQAMQQMKSGLPKKNQTAEVIVPGRRCGILQVAVSQSEIDKIKISLDNIIVVSDGEAINKRHHFGGLISDVASPEGSHIVVLARSLKSPCVAEEGACNKWQHLNGKPVELTATASGYDVKEISLEELAKQKKGTRLSGAAKEIVLQANYDDKTLADLSQTPGPDGIQHLGSKAFHYQELYHLLGREHVHPGFAIPFAAYRDYLHENKIDADIEAMLSNPRVNTDETWRNSELELIQKKILAGKIPDAWSKDFTEKFPKTHDRWRMRSSSNAEDLGWFNGAGLYTSVGVDPQNQNSWEPGLKSVWASLWTDLAYTARAQAGINQRQIAMGILMNPAFDDEDANGVIYTGLGNSPEKFKVIIQKGALSVTNPEARSRPEIWDIDRTTGEKTKRQNSNVIAKNVLNAKEFETVRKTVATIHDFYGAPMDLEFKITEEVLDGKKKRHLMVKQARPYIENIQASDGLVDNKTSINSEAHLQVSSEGSGAAPAR